MQTISLLFLLLPFAGAQEDSPYFPPRGSWESRPPAAVGMDPAKLEAAVTFAQENGASTDRDLRAFIAKTLADEPHGEIVGPTRERGDTNGLIVRRGYIVAEWGPTRRVDMTFSVTKTYLSTVVGLALDSGLIEGVDDPVHQFVPEELFDTERERRITWDHLLRQTSDWRGTLFTKRDWADRPPRGASPEEMQNLPEQEPGAAWEYNDVRVNLLALCALHVWREPLPVVLRERVLDPIGASRTWRWHGYETSWVELDGLRMQSVSGGGHWGGGMFISTRDQARFGYLMLRGGVWGGRQIVSEAWIDAARTPTPAYPGYGYMNWFLNTEVERDGQRARPSPSAPADSVAFLGAGTNVVYLDRENDLLIVLRWFENRALDGVVQRVLAAIRE